MQAVIANYYQIFGTFNMPTSYRNRGCRKERGGFLLVHGDLPRRHPFGTTFRFTDPMPADSCQ